MRTKRVRNGRHRLESGFPYSRLMAATMLATLVSALFTLPAHAAANQIDLNVVGSAPAVLPNATYTYTVTLTNNSGVDADTLSFTDTVTGGGTMTGATPSAGGVCSAPALNATDCAFATLTIGSSATVTINVTAPGSIGTVTDTVSAFADTQGDAAAGTLVANTTVEDANVQVTKTHAPASVNPGGSFTYTLAVKNNGPSDAVGVQVTDNAPTGVTFGVVSVSATAGSFTCGTTTSTQVSCGPWTVPNGVTVTVTIAATLALTATGQITNTASETSTTLDSVMGNNSSADVLTPAQADLAVQLSVNPTSTAPNGTVTYTVSLQNLDPAVDATNVTVTDTLPSGLTAVTPPTSTSVGTATVANNVWTWVVPTVVHASMITASFDATVDAAVPLNTTITNTVGIIKADQGDPVVSNNTASTDLAIVPGVADLTVTSAVDNAKPSQGDLIAIAIQVSNAGPDDATNVVLKDVLPNGLKYKSCTGCSRKAWTGLFTAASIPAGSAATVTLNVVVQASSGTLKNTASIQSSDQSDPNGADNRDSLNITVGGSSNNSGGGGGNGSGSSGSGSGTSGSGGTAFTGFTAAQLMPWFMLLFSVGLAAVELSRRRSLVSPIGYTYGFDRPF